MNNKREMRLTIAAVTRFMNFSRITVPAIPIRDPSSLITTNRVNSPVRGTTRLVKLHICKYWSARKKEIIIPPTFSKIITNLHA